MKFCPSTDTSNIKNILWGNPLNSGIGRRWQWFPRILVLTINFVFYKGLKCLILLIRLCFPAIEMHESHNYRSNWYMLEPFANRIFSIVDKVLCRENLYKSLILQDNPFFRTLKFFFSWFKFCNPLTLQARDISLQ